MISFRELKYGPVGRASGLDVESCDFAQYCNDSVRQLMNRGNWRATVHPLRACVRDYQITWPRGVATIMAINFCHNPAMLSNQWFRFMQPSHWHRQAFLDYMKYGWGGISQQMVSTENTSPVFNTIKTEGFVIRTFITQPTDVGKTITYYGTDVNGQPIRTTRSDGTVQDGIQVTLAAPSADTSVAIRHVSRIVKDTTDGDVIAYQYNLATGLMLDLGRYQPTETNPNYLVTQMYGQIQNRGCGCQEQVDALVKMEFVPFRYEGDLVQIDNQDSIRDMLLALRKKEQGDIAASLAYETSAIRELNFEMRNRYPDEQFIVNFRPFGRDDLNDYNTRVGMI